MATFLSHKTMDTTGASMSKGWLSALHRQHNTWKQVLRFRRVNVQLALMLGTRQNWKDSCSSNSAKNSSSLYRETSTYAKCRKATWLCSLPQCTPLQHLLYAYKRCLADSGPGPIYSSSWLWEAYKEGMRVHSFPAMLPYKRYYLNLELAS